MDSTEFILSVVPLLVIIISVTHPSNSVHRYCSCISFVSYLTTFLNFPIVLIFWTSLTVMIMYVVPLSDITLARMSCRPATPLTRNGLDGSICDYIAIKPEPGKMV